MVGGFKREQESSTPADDLKFQTREMRRECLNLPLSLYAEWYWQTGHAAG
jgi:hypothetical protein